jgi:hypothetical protein
MQVPFHWHGYIPALYLAHLTLHSKLYICPGGSTLSILVLPSCFHNLTTWFKLDGLNGGKFGLCKLVSLFTLVFQRKKCTAIKKKVYHILIITYMFRSLLLPSSECFTRIQIIHNYCLNFINKTTRRYNEYLQRYISVNIPNWMDMDRIKLSLHLALYAILSCDIPVVLNTIRWCSYQRWMIWAMWILQYSVLWDTIWDQIMAHYKGRNMLS